MGSKWYIGGFLHFVISEFVIPSFSWFSFRHWFCEFYAISWFSKKNSKKSKSSFTNMFFSLLQEIDLPFLLLYPFLNLKTKIFKLEITICDKKFNKHKTIDLKMVFQWQKNIIISGKKAQKVDFWKLLDPVWDFTLKTVPEPKSHGMWGTSCNCALVKTVSIYFIVFFANL